MGERYCSDWLEWILLRYGKSGFEFAIRVLIGAYDEQHFLVEKCQARKMNAQAAYICVCLCSFAKVEKVRQQKRISVTELFKRLHREPRRISKNHAKNVRFCFVTRIEQRTWMYNVQFFHKMRFLGGNHCVSWRCFEDIP
jgi:hypothetical protein